MSTPRKDGTSISSSLTPSAHEHAPGDTGAPHPGVQTMPQWNVAHLIDAPDFTWRKMLGLIGPAILMAGAAIGGGEWLVGPTVTAKYGGALMWLATLSILGQVLYNIEISRYTLYCGEPIFTGKFRTMPGPMFWVGVYLFLDLGSVFPYLAANAATPVAAIILGRIPDSSNASHRFLMQAAGIGVFLLAFLPSIFGGKIYNSLKLVMSVKVFVVLSFLLFIGLVYSKPATWFDVFSGFVKFGNVPVHVDEDKNGNGVLDPGEDWDNDKRLDKAEFKWDQLARRPKGITGAGTADNLIVIDKKSYPDLDKDKVPDEKVHVDVDGDGSPDTWISTRPNTESEGITFTGKYRWWADLDNDNRLDGVNIENVAVNLITGKPLPKIDLSLIAFLCAFAAIAGSGGLSNAPTSNYTRDQGWGMGHHVGAIPSLVGGQDITLSHVGTVFVVTEEAIPRWRKWVRHVMRDQLLVWMPACFFGIALPSMLSVEFLPRGVEADSWAAAGMTADGVMNRVTTVSGMTVGQIFWYMTLFCGFLTLAPTMATTADGYIRRWVDVFWTSSSYLRTLSPDKIKYVYFTVLVGYLLFGVSFMLIFPEPTGLVKIATQIMNFALGISCWHVLVLNNILLPKPLRPGWLSNIGMFLAGLFFLVLASVTAAQSFGLIK